MAQNTNPMNKIPKSTKEMIEFVNVYKKLIIPSNDDTVISNIKSYIENELNFKLYKVNLKPIFLAYSVPSENTIIYDEEKIIDKKDEAYIFAHEIFHILAGQESPLRTEVLYSSGANNLLEPADLFAYLLLKDFEGLVKNKIKTFMQSIVENE